MHIHQHLFKYQSGSACSSQQRLLRGGSSAGQTPEHVLRPPVLSGNIREVRVMPPAWSCNILGQGAKTRALFCKIWEQRVPSPAFVLSDLIANSVSRPLLWLARIQGSVWSPEICFVRSRSSASRPQLCLSCKISKQRVTPRVLQDLGAAPHFPSFSRRCTVPSVQLPSQMHRAIHPIP